MSKVDTKILFIKQGVERFETEHKVELEALGEQEKKIQCEIEQRGESTYVEAAVSPILKHFDCYYEEKSTLSKYIKDNFERLVKIYVPEQLVNDYYQIIDDFVNFPYTRGYSRRTLRTNQVRVHVRSAFSLMYGYKVLGYFGCSVKEYITDELTDEMLDFKHETYWSCLWGFQSVIDNIIAARINQGDQEVIGVIRDAFTSDNNTVIVTVEMIRAVVKSRNKELRQLLGGFLCAARLQEGVRQAICENADCGLPDSLIEIMDVIEKGGLIRFSAVKRAVATWTGICDWENVDRITDKVFSSIKTAISDKTAARSMISTDDCILIIAGLWGLGFYDVTEAMNVEEELLNGGSRQQLLALSYFNCMLQESWFTNSFAEKVIVKHEEDWELIAAYMTTFMQDYEKIVNDIKRDAYRREKTSDKESKKIFRELEISELDMTMDEALLNYNILKKTRSSIQKRKVQFTPCIFPGYGVRLDKSEIVKRMAVLAYALKDEKYIDEVCEMLSDIDGAYSDRATYIELLLCNPTNDNQRKALIGYLQDKETNARQKAFSLLKNMTFSTEEYHLMESFLKYKNEETRRYVLLILLGQNAKDVIISARNLLESSNENIRMAGLDLAKLLCKYDNYREEMAGITKQILGTQTLSQPMQILYDEIVKTHDSGEKQSGKKYGLYDPNEVVSIPESPTHLEVFHSYFNVTKEELDEAFKQFYIFITKHSKDEYQSVSDTCLLGNGLKEIEYDSDTPYYERYPFKELWGEVYDSIIKTPKMYHNMMLAICSEHEECEIEDYELYKKTSKLLYGEGISSYEIPVKSYEKALQTRENERYSVVENDIFLRIVETVMYIIELLKETELTFPTEVAIEAIKFAAELSEEYRWYKKKDQYRYGCGTTGKKTSFVNTVKFKYLLPKLKLQKDSEIYKNIFFNLYQLDQAYKFKEHAGKQYYWEEQANMLSVYDYVKACTMGLISESEIYKYIFENLGPATSLEQLNHFLEESPGKDLLLEKVNANVINAVLEVELKRGDIATVFSKCIDKIGKIYGMNRFVEILNALGKLPLDRSAHYSFSKSIGKKECLCHLLKVCEPLVDDTAEKLKEYAETYHISEERLIETAMCAPQWMKIMEEYLNYPGFTSGCYYFMAHMNESFGQKTEAVIAKYTPLNSDELMDGAFDIKWFFEAYDMLGEKLFDKLYKAAKYISDGSKHTRARKYADAALGRVSSSDLEKAIVEKRNKDLLMSYGLVPIEDEKDVQRRYEFIQQFLKESKQFGSLRRTSEAKAVEMALKNLASNAGFADELRLILFMEAAIVEEKATFFDRNKVGDYEVQVQVDSMGKVTTLIFNGDKMLKSAPAAIKKNETLLRIKEFEKKLKEQYNRCKAMFERAMEDREIYTVEELCKLSKNPVTKAIIDKLVFVIEEPENETTSKIAFYMLKEFEKLDGKSHVRVAHPYDLHTSDQWEKWQRIFFEMQKNDGVKQSFKQVFRELYLKIPEELNNTQSRLFSGYQISPTRTIAALKNRQWIADYENGLQKIYYKDNIIAVIYAMADWFSPADMEAPTLEYVVFYNRKTFERIKISEVPDIIYSEIMRDTDLAVSLAHVGGVDPITTHSTIEMRTVIAQFNLELFAIKNVTFEKSHAFIKGKYGEYSIHLGSGVIHKVGGALIHVLPVHSQKRGKMFLPFVDDDPKTAEIMSKILLFAKDDKVKDPYIMKQIV